MVGRILHTKSGSRLLAALITLSSAFSAVAQTPDAIQAAIEVSYEKYRNLMEGTKADHNPAVAKLDPSLSGIALLTADGEVYTAGAISVTSMVKGETREEVRDNILDTFSDFAGRRLSVSEEVYRADSATNVRNQAIAKLMYSYGRIEKDPLGACEMYTLHCAISVNVQDLAVVAVCREA